MPENHNPIRSRQIQVENHQIIVEFGGHRPRLFSICGYIDRVMFCFQPFPHKTGQCGIVFGYQYAHLQILCVEMTPFLGVGLT